MCCYKMLVTCVEWVAVGRDNVVGGVGKVGVVS